MKNYLYLFMAFLFMSACAASKKTETFWLSGINAPCADENDSVKCLHVIRAENIENKSWETLNATIDGVSPQKGVLQKVEVKKVKSKDKEAIAYKSVNMLETIEDTRFQIDGEWVLNTLKREKPSTSILPTLKIEVEKMRISGNGGCNQYFAEIIDFTNNKIETRPAIATLMACKNDNIESLFLKTLNDIYSYGLINNRLLFFNEKGEELFAFIKNTQKEINPLLAGTWKAVNVLGEKMLKEENTPDLTIDIQEKRFNGKDGCNNYFGSFESLSDQQMIFGNVASTKKMCMEMEIPNAYHQALRQTASYQLRDSAFILLDTMGNILAEFEKQ